MEEPKKKKKYIEKSVYEAMKKEQGETTQKASYKEKDQKTRVINVKVEHLRKQGFNNLVQWLQNKNHVYIGRHNHYVPGAVGSVWANPFKVQEYGRQGCIQKFKEYVLQNKELMSQLPELKGKVLGCWCAPEGCHGDVLAQLADSLK